MSLIIPQSNPKANYLAHKDEIDAAIARALDSGWYILGQEVAAFEQEFAAYIGVSHAVGVASGTDALKLSLRACGIGQGDLVFTVSHTAVATVAAIALCGATPVFVDIDPATFTMSPESLAEAVARAANDRRKRPRAIIPVHLYGHPADMLALTEIARRYDLRVIEDCAQSHGATWQGRKTGAWGHLGAFSCYPTKNLGALGDGGIIVTDDGDLAAQLRLLREYGWKERYVSIIPGDNSRLDVLQAAILRVKLRHLEDDNSHRRHLAAQYRALLSETDVRLPQTHPDATHVFHQFVLRCGQRDDLRSRLREDGIGSLIHYPVPVHQQPAYARFGEGASLPHTEEAAREVLSLPLYPELGSEAVREVAACVTAWARR